MKKILLVVFCLWLTGCTTTDGVRAANREKLLKLSLGMPKEEVMSTMGTKTISAYGDIFGSGGSSIINNPYRSEILQGKDKVFEVLYYYTDVKKRDDAVTDDELTPLVFDNGKLIGWGWGFLQDNAQKYEIRMR